MAAALGSALSWALGSVLFRRLGDRLPPVSLTFAKGAVGTLLLGVAAAFVGWQPVGIEAAVLLALSGLLGIALGDTLFFMALNSLGAQATVILFTVGQVLTVVMAVLWLGERPNPMDWAGVGLILTGVTAVMWSRSEGGGTSTLKGAAWGLLAVLAMSVSVIMAKEAVIVVGSVQATFIRFCVGTAGILTFGHFTGHLLQDLEALREPRFLGLFLGSVGVVTFGGFWLSMLAIANVEVVIANTLNATEPLFVVPLAALLLKERITAAVIFGSVATVCGMVLIIAPW
jgi:drug/metabolite transporter (DMT)-like permease